MINLLKEGFLKKRTSGGISSIKPKLNKHDFPNIVISGDGHRTPSFAWAEVANDLFFAHLKSLTRRANQLIVHVEDRQPSFKNVPKWMNSSNVKIISLEPESEATLGEFLNTLIEGFSKVSSNADNNHRLIKSLFSGFLTLHNKVMVEAEVKPKQLDPALILLTDGEKNTNIGEEETLRLYQKVQNIVMEYRGSGYNVNIAAHIQKTIDAFPDATHLISIGNIHITDQDSSVQQYIKTIAETWGIADPDQGKGLG